MRDLTPRAQSRMATGMKETQRSIRLTEAQLQGHIDNGLRILKHLCDRYDNGHPYVVFTMATEIQRILDSNAYARRLSGSKNYPSPKSRSDRTNLLADPKLVVASISGDPPVVDFIPVFCGRPEVKTESLKFRDWWSRDKIYRASAALPGMPGDLIPVRPEEQVPYEERDTLVRERFIDMMRDKLGAHLDEEIPEALDNMQKSHSFGVSLSVQTPSGEFNTHDGTLPVRTGPAAAMMRQISQEVLVAYGLEAMWVDTAISAP